VVTDHHRPGPVLPDCPVVHPALGGYPFEHLCGAAVALKLSEALRAAAELDPAAAEEDVDLAGLATLCDMVPLVGENRRIAKAGLAALARTRKAGLRALMGVAALEPGDVDERSAGFRLGPRLNAAGRMGRADAALELLLTEDGERAAEIARELDGLNHDRRETERRIVAEAETQCAAQLSQAAIVVAGEGWHPGVVGIVASRLVERHHRPAVAIALDGESGRGSGRSIGPYDLHAGLSHAADLLLRHGGHRMAAGLEIEAARVADLRAALAEHAGTVLAPDDLLPVQDSHAMVGVAALTLDVAEELERLAPFGAGNPPPVLTVPAARIEHVTAMGAEREHCRFTLAGGSARARGVAFRTSQRALAEAGGEPHDVSLALERNRWNGAVEARVVLRSVSRTRVGEIVEVGPAPPLVDAIASELTADPTTWWRADSGAGAGPGGPAPAPARAHPLAERRSRQPLARHEQGGAGVAADLLSSGESVLVVVADLARRRAGLAQTIAAIGRGPLPVAEWESLLTAPGAAAEHDHMLVLDPPPVAAAIARVVAAGTDTTVHLTWTAVERDFALACWRERLMLRPGLIELWRALAAAGTLTGQPLVGALRGTAQHPRTPAHCGRLVRVLTELELAIWDASDPDAPRLSVGSATRTDLDRSPAHRAYAHRLAAVEQHLAATAPPVRRATA
jgi:single-stranded-DNA-specific exonuclease